MKVCTKCGEKKALTEFHHTKRNSDGRIAVCKNCTSEWNRNYSRANKERIAERGRIWSKANREKKREQQRRWYRNNRFSSVLFSSKKHARKYDWVPCNATKEELEVAFTGKCHACGVPELELNRRLNMDHCHETGEFRGWLCENCNKALGLLKNSSDRILALAKYIERVSVLTPSL